MPPDRRSSGSICNHSQLPLLKDRHNAMASQAQPLAQTEPAQPTPQVPAFGFSLIAGRHKSLVPPLTWQCIPPLAILSGMNGSGKTQLMQAIAMQYDENVRRRGRHSDVELRFDEHKYAPHDVFYLEQFDSFFNNDAISLSNYNETIDNLRSNNSSDVFQKLIAKKNPATSSRPVPFRRPVC